MHITFFVSDPQKRKDMQVVLQELVAVARELGSAKVYSSDADDGVVGINTSPDNSSYSHYPTLELLLFLMNQVGGNELVEEFKSESTNKLASDIKFSEEILEDNFLKNLEEGVVTTKLARFNRIRLSYKAENLIKALETLKRVTRQNLLRHSTFPRGVPLIRD